jgi:DNA-binding protein H-NS
MMANNNSRDIIYVHEYMLDILVQLRHLLELYKTVRKSETELIELLTKEIERISEGHGNFFIKTLINEYEYPRYFDNEQDDEEIYDVDPFTLSNRNNS